MSGLRFSYPQPEQAAQACARHIFTRVEEALAGSPQASLAISGGTSPKILFEQLVAARPPWERIHLFWVDERCVPPADSQSNFGLAEQMLIRPARIPTRNVHRIQGELRPDDAARRYREEIRETLRLAAGELPRFDVVHQGIGADGHTASLFPGEPLLDDHDNVAAAVYVEKFNQWRVTLLPGALLAARHTVFFVNGADKAPVVRTILHGEYDYKKYPAQVVSRHGRGVVWFLDEAAASLLES